MTLEALLHQPVVAMARELVGWSLRYAGCGGVIVETEAYHESEPACHAFAGRTRRTETLFCAPGVVYVYRSYGIHAMLNIVAEPSGVGAAVLIRALAPLDEVDLMRRRRGLDTLEQLCSGPGKLTQALGIPLTLDGASLIGGPITLHPPVAGEPRAPLVVGRRVGITKAAELPWRFAAEGSAFVSRPRPWAWTAAAVG